MEVFGGRSWRGNETPELSYSSVCWQRGKGIHMRVWSDLQIRWAWWVTSLGAAGGLGLPGSPWLRLYFGKHRVSGSLGPRAWPLTCRLLSDINSHSQACSLSPFFWKRKQLQKVPLTYSLWGEEEEPGSDLDFLKKSCFDVVQANFFICWSDRDHGGGGSSGTGRGDSESETPKGGVSQPWLLGYLQFSPRIPESSQGKM